MYLNQVFFQQKCKRKHVNNKTHFLDHWLSRNYADWEVVVTVTSALWNRLWLAHLNVKTLFDLINWWSNWLFSAWCLVLWVNHDPNTVRVSHSSAKVFLSHVVWCHSTQLFKVFLDFVMQQGDVIRLFLVCSLHISRFVPFKKAQEHSVIVFRIHFLLSARKAHTELGKTSFR